MKKKPTNPKDMFGVRKVSLMSVLPLRVLAGVALAFLEGALKYGRHNYRNTGVLASVYVDAAVRHIGQFWEGEDIDHDSGAKLHHIDKAIASLMVLRDSMLHGNFRDDRPPRTNYDWIGEANATAANLIGNVKRPVAPFTEKKNP